MIECHFTLISSSHDINGKNLLKIMFGESNEIISKTNIKNKHNSS